MKDQNNLFILITVLVACSYGCETALEMPLDKSRVILLAPKDSFSTDVKRQTFYWEKVDGASQYQLQIVSPGFSSIEQLIEDTAINSNQFTTDLGEGIFEWRVRALNYSSASDFSVINFLEIH